LNRLIVLLLSLSLILCLPILILRYRLETHNRKVEICLDWAAFKARCREENYPWEEFLLKIREYGISSLGLSEDNFSEIKEKIYIFSAEEREKLVLLGLISPAALPLGETWVFADKKFSERIKSILETRSKSFLPLLKRGDYFFLFLPSGTNYQECRFGYSLEKINQAKNYGLKVILQMENFAPSELGILNEDIFLSAKENISGVILNDFSRADVFREKEIKIALPEFQKINNRKYLVSSAVRLHYLGQEEYSFYPTKAGSLNTILKRLVRAVKERNVRILYLYPLPKEYLAEKENYFQGQYTFFWKLKEILEKENFQFASAEPFNLGKKEFFSQKTRFIRQFLSFAFACFLPFLGLKFSSPQRKAMANFLICTFFSFSAGILIVTLLSGEEFFLKLDEFRGTKLSLVLPLLFAFFYLYRSEWNKILSQEVKVKHLCLFLFIFLFFVLFLLRSGEHFSFLLPGEDKLRLILENIFLVRPRTKEFLFGHPLLILGFFLLNRPLILLGLIGQVSIVNTFAHLHTPLSILFLRTFYGLFLGTLCGLGLLKSYTFIKEKNYGKYFNLWILWFWKCW